jgi:hypothetical protein
VRSINELMWRAMPARLKARGLFLGAGGITASFGNKVSAFFYLL